MGQKGKDGDALGPVVPSNIKGIMNIFKKQNVNKPKNNSIFQKMNKFSSMLKSNSL